MAEVKWSSTEGSLEPRRGWRSAFGHIFSGRPISPEGVIVNFMLLALFFSINHATITSFIAIGSSVTSNVKGGYFTGTLYVTYVLIALTFSSAIVEYLKPWKSLCVAMFIYIFYIVGYIIVKLAPLDDDNEKTAFAISCSAIAGVSAGFLWTAQGKFFTRSAQLYSEATGMELKTVTRRMGGVFASLYVGFEFIGKMATSVIRNSGTDFSTLAVIYASVAFAAAVGTCLFVRDLPEDPANVVQEKLAFGRLMRKTMTAVELIRTSRKLWLIIPLQVAFGFTAAFFNNFLAGTIVTAAVGTTNVGYVTSVTPATAALLSLVVGYISPLTGNGPLLILGSVCYTVIPILLVAVPEQTFEDLGFGIIFFYAVQGVGRVMFETSNRALISETFPKDSEAAFSNSIIWSGLASTIGYFVFPVISVAAKSIISLSAGALSIISMTVLFFFSHRFLTRKELLVDADDAAATQPLINDGDTAKSLVTPDERPLKLVS